MIHPSALANVPELKSMFIIYVWPYFTNILSSDDGHDDYVPLTILVEVLGGKPLPGSSELVITLLDSLSKVINDGSVPATDKIYIEQLLLSALDNAVSNISVWNISSDAESTLTVPRLRIAKLYKQFALTH
jgi:hypothetical protein